jgi:DNA polymerase-3 subunit alpha
MAAVLTYESGAKKIEDWAPYIGDCNRVFFPDHSDTAPHIGFEVGSPDLNHSDALFSVVFNDDEVPSNLGGHILFGLGAVKGSGNSAVCAIVEEREQGGLFTSIFDFCSRVSSRSVNRATIESLIRGGAFDSLHGPDKRSALLAVLDRAIAIGASTAKDKESGQGGLFGGKDTIEANPPEYVLPDVVPWSKTETLRQEKEVLGIHVSGHPLDEYGTLLDSWCTDTISSLKEGRDGRRIIIGGILTAVRIHIIRKGRSAGQKMAILTIQDKLSKVECVAFSDSYRKYAHLLQQDAVVLVDGKTDRSRGELQIIVDLVSTIQDASLYLTKRIELTFHEGTSNGSTKGQMELVSGLLSQAGAAKVSLGANPVEVVVHINSGKHITTLKSQKRVVVEPKLIQQISDVIGQDNIQLISVLGN